MIADGMLGEIYHVYASFRAYRFIPGLAETLRQSRIGRGTLIYGGSYLDLDRCLLFHFLLPGFLFFGSFRDLRFGLFSFR